MISAKIIADSISPQGHRITTFELVFPRMILAELNTHRLFSRNSASSRAIPFSKMVKAVQDNPFIPIAWQKEHKGMQGSEYITEQMIQEWSVEKWLEARDNAVKLATELNQGGVTKQLCNRLLEPFMYHKVLLTATEFDNFFELRCPNYEQMTSYNLFKHKSRKDYLKEVGLPDSVERYKDWTDVDWLQINKGQSEIHMMALAEAMWDAYNESVPNQLKSGEWHIPYATHVSQEVLDYYGVGEITERLIKVSTAKCARVSYTTVGEDGKEIPYEKDIALHDSLLSSGHFSPFEHCARAMSDEEYNDFIKGKKIVTHSEPEYDDLFEFNESSLGWCNNFRGWISYRYLLENQ